MHDDLTREVNRAIDRLTGPFARISTRECIDAAALLEKLESIRQAFLRPLEKSAGDGP